MILIVTALRIEAVPFIDYYKLKRDMTFKRYEVFKSRDDSVTLLITRPGKLQAAIALTELLTCYDITPYDYMINIGICGCFSAPDILRTPPVYLCHSILDHDTGRRYYPDMSVAHPFKEADLETFSVAVNSNNSDQVSAALVDMEASALFEAGNYHFTTGQMFFVKIPSDTLKPETVSKDRVASLMADNAPVITDWLDILLRASCNTSATDSHLSDDELILFNTLSEKLRLSVTMKEQLRQLFIYKKLKDGYLSVAETFSLPEDNNISYQKRKILFEELRNQFLQ